VTSPYLPSAIPPVTAHVTATHHYLALAAGGAFARSRVDTGWRQLRTWERDVSLAAT